MSRRAALPKNRLARPNDVEYSVMTLPELEIAADVYRCSAVGCFI